MKDSISFLIHPLEGSGGRGPFLSADLARFAVVAVGRSLRLMHPAAANELSLDDEKAALLIVFAALFEQLLGGRYNDPVKLTDFAIAELVATVEDSLLAEIDDVPEGTHVDRPAAFDHSSFQPPSACCHLRVGWDELRLRS